MDIERLPDEGEFFTKYFYANTSWGNEGQDPAGYFETTLEDGTYNIRGAGGQNGWFELNFKFIVRDGLLLDKDGNPISELDVRKPAPNIKGHVYKNLLKELYLGNHLLSEIL